MLTQLSIRNFAIVDSLDLELENGMTVVSGETGAGKSIMLDALALALGDRADSGAVRQGADRAEINAVFSLSSCPEAQRWLEEQELHEGEECMLRRVINTDGRSRCYINGSPAPAGTVKQLGELLVAIHGQHEHQRLLKKEYHRNLLDNYAALNPLAQQVKQAFQAWQQLASRLRQLTEQNDEQQARLQLLRYQVEELDQLSLAEGEIEQLEQEQKLLENAGDIQHNGHQILQLVADNDEVNCLQLLNHSLQLINKMDSQHPALLQASEMLNGALIQAEEASTEIRHFLDQVEIDPERQQEVEERLGTVYDIARKHRIKPAALLAQHQALAEELDSLQGGDASIENLTARVADAEAAYLALATELSHKRASAAQELGNLVGEQLHLLGMPAAQLNVALNMLKTPAATGLEEIELMIITNAGQPAKPLAKIASGGELSRISLAIQVITAQTSSTPTLIFDEVDVGIGGGVAEVVGRLLRQLGEQAQILCVTHQPQVAAQGHQHLFVSKKSEQSHTSTDIQSLEEEHRVQEIARMLGGIDITATSLQHAREMLGSL
ncbi:DNA repair protein RecN [Neptuniibacter sp. CAU 1671]|uniref:DNA repair protein RecN n=1 Tax=Neptuniibacter sp. CAU 1671 TaxID=3032593 RepID=UPI0023D9E38C|nr:DNA repair protein RecN [Neptuniibacter sp. CAU 1671]MDF2181255.1 DNA repair protein RecN [Neptuniibacter sp. CAU 1671]